MIEPAQNGCAPYVAKLVAGLGNPGERYRNTRHNAGFMVVDELSRRAGEGRWIEDGDALIRRCRLAQRPLTLAKPVAWMNRSGGSVARLLETEGWSARDLLLVLDDFHLPLGRLRIRRQGSAGGHNGLDSVIASLGTDAFPRVRLGVGEESMPEDKSGFVLADFPAARESEVREMIGKAADAVMRILEHGLDQAMSAFNA